MAKDLVSAQGQRQIIDRILGQEAGKFQGPLLPHSRLPRAPRDEALVIIVGSMYLCLSKTYKDCITFASRLQQGSQDSLFSTQAGKFAFSEKRGSHTDELFATKTMMPGVLEPELSIGHDRYLFHNLVKRHPDKSSSKSKRHLLRSHLSIDSSCAISLKPSK